MDLSSVDFTQVWSLITKGGWPAVILAFFIGAAHLITAVRGGKVSTIREGDLLKKLEEFRQELDEHRREIDALKEKVDERDFIIRVLFRQRDQARTIAEKHGYDPGEGWPGDPVWPSVGPVVTQVLPPGADEGGIR